MFGLTHYKLPLMTIRGRSTESQYSTNADRSKYGSLGCLSTPRIEAHRLRLRQQIFAIEIFDAASGGCSYTIARRKHSMAPKCIATVCAASMPSISSVGLNARKAATAANIC